MATPHDPDPAASLLVGRERELALLRNALAAALSGRGGLILVGGEAGLGKTTLAEATLAEAATQGALALVGRCYDRTETPPYGPWVEALARAPAGDDLPALPAAVLPPAHDDGAPLASQDAILRRVRDYLAALAARRPLVLLLDDVHWADPASLDLLRVVARDLRALPMLLLATYRDDELTRRHPLYALLPLLDREAQAARLNLRRFDAEDVGALVVERYALPEADADRLVAWLHGRAEGNAFFVTQLLRALEETGALRQAGGGWALGDLGAVGLPLPLRQVLDARLARLDEDSHRLLALAAVVGQDVPLALWATVAETDEEGLLDAIDAAGEARLVQATPDGGAVRFAHALIREALYDGLVATRRRRVHRRVAEALAAVPGPDPDAVADHFRRAGDPRAVAWLWRARLRPAHRRRPPRRGAGAAAPRRRARRGAGAAALRAGRDAAIRGPAREPGAPGGGHRAGRRGRGPRPGPAGPVPPGACALPGRRIPPGAGGAGGGARRARYPHRGGAGGGRVAGGLLRVGAARPRAGARRPGRMARRGGALRRSPAVLGGGRRDARAARRAGAGAAGAHQPGRGRARPRRAGPPRLPGGAAAGAGAPAVRGGPAGGAPAGGGRGRGRGARGGRASAGHGAAPRLGPRPAAARRGALGRGPLARAGPGRRPRWAARGDHPRAARAVPGRAGGGVGGGAAGAAPGQVAARPVAASGAPRSRAGSCVAASVEGVPGEGCGHPLSAHGTGPADEYTQADGAGLPATATTLPDLWDRTSCR